MVIIAENKKGGWNPIFLDEKKFFISVEFCILLSKFVVVRKKFFSAHA